MAIYTCAYAEYPTHSTEKQQNDPLHDGVLPLSISLPQLWWNKHQLEVVQGVATINWTEN